MYMYSHTHIPIHTYTHSHMSHHTDTDSASCSTVVYEQGRQLPASLRHKVERDGLTLISSEWLPQCLIHGYALDHKDFLWGWS